MKDKLVLDFQEITRRLKQLPALDVDRVLGIAQGGIVPAALVAYQLEKPLSMFTINYRAKDDTPQRQAPVLLDPVLPPAPPVGERVLLVDDVSVSGQTLNLARSLLPGCQVITLVMKGRADLVLFPEIKVCVQWPWKTANVLQTGLFASLKYLPMRGDNQ